MSLGPPEKRNRKVSRSKEVASPPNVPPKLKNNNTENSRKKLHIFYKFWLNASQASRK